MTPYTSDEIFILLGNVTCLHDINEIVNYLIEDRRHFSTDDLFAFNRSVEIYLEGIERSMKK